MTVSTEPAPALQASKRRFPDFFIVGHAKCGTTALYEMLRRHPQVFMPSRKEPQFFARDPRPSRRGSHPPRFEQTGRYGESLDEYLSLFAAAGPEQRVGEASTFYLWSRTAPARIAEAQPDARIIAILREPASFVHSVHLQTLQNGSETEPDLRRAIALEPARRSGRDIPSRAYWPEALMYSERVRYVEQLRRYHEAFGPEQVLVLIYEDFRRENEATVRAVLRFLEVDDTRHIDVVEANPTLSVRSARLAALLAAFQRRRGPVSNAAREAARRLVTGQLGRAVLYPAWRRLMYAAPPPPDEEMMRELRKLFKPEVVALSDYLGRDLVSLWGYDGVA
jgi:hypothetical protein